MLKVLFFGRLKELLDCDGLSVEAAQVCDVADLRALLVAGHDGWQRHLQASSVLVAVNQQMAGDQTGLKAGDEVAFFPPVTGG